MTCENNIIILHKKNLVLNMWDDDEFEELVDRSTNTYLSKILTTPYKIPQQSVVPNNTPGIKYRRHLAARKNPIKNLIKAFVLNIHGRK
jgi:hypothetical protein